MAVPSPEARAEDLCARARAASRALAGADRPTKDRLLRAAASKIRSLAPEILSASAAEVEEAARGGAAAAFLDRLRLTAPRVEAMARALEAVADLPDPVGETLEENVRPNGLKVRKVRVPIGVILFIYESRPNVTVEGASLCLKAGNAILLKGGREAQRSCALLAESLRSALRGEGLDPDAVQAVPAADRGLLQALLRAQGRVDLAIPRGGESLIRAVAEAARVPVVKHYKGVCHVYVDAGADPAMAEAITVDAKCDRPGVCNAMETLLVHRDEAAAALPRIAAALMARGVEIRGCDRTRAAVPGARPASDEDFGTEFLDLILAVRVVDSLEEAVDHIARRGSGHTDAIVTNDDARAQRFVEAVDSGVVLVNASTRFNDGGELGLGAEIGISTDRIHARGPMGLRELTTYKWVVHGSGQVRKTS